MRRQTPPMLAALSQGELFELNCRLGRGYRAAHWAGQPAVRDELFGTLCGEVLPLIDT